MEDYKDLLRKAYQKLGEARRNIGNVLVPTGGQVNLRSAILDIKEAEAILENVQVQENKVVLER